MASLARSAQRNPEFSRATVRLTGARHASIDEIDRVLRPVFLYRDEYEEVVRTPERMLDDLEKLGHVEGDCDDISTLFAAFALVAGYRVRFVAIRHNRFVQHFEHVFVEVADGWAWRVVDLTVTIGTKIHALEVMNQEV